MTEIVHAAHLFDKSNDVKAIILTGLGTKAFAAGADIKEMVSQTYSEVSPLYLTSQHTVNAAALLPKF